MNIIQSIVDYFSNIDMNIDILIILKNLGVIAVGAFLLPILFIITLYIFGFTTQGIAAGSSAALWMASIGNVNPGSPLSRLQSISRRGLLLIIHPTMFRLEVTMGLLTTVFLLRYYSFDVDVFLNDISMIFYHQTVHFIHILLNYILSILIDILLGIIFGGITGYYLFGIIQLISRNNDDDKKTVLIFLLSFFRNDNWCLYRHYSPFPFLWINPLNIYIIRLF